MTRRCLHTIGPPSPTYPTGLQRDSVDHDVGEPEGLEERSDGARVVALVEVAPA